MDKPATRPSLRIDTGCQCSSAPWKVGHLRGKETSTDALQRAMGTFPKDAAGSPIPRVHTSTRRSSSPHVRSASPPSDGSSPPSDGFASPPSDCSSSPPSSIGSPTHPSLDCSQGDPQDCPAAPNPPSLPEGLNVQALDAETAEARGRRLVELALADDPEAVYWADLITVFDRLWADYARQQSKLRFLGHQMRMHADFMSAVERDCLRNGRQDLQSDISNLLGNVLVPGQRFLPEGDGWCHGFPSQRPPANCSFFNPLTFDLNLNSTSELLPVALSPWHPAREFARPSLPPFYLVLAQDIRRPPSTLLNSNPTDMFTLPGFHAANEVALLEVNRIPSQLQDAAADAGHGAIVSPHSDPTFRGTGPMYEDGSGKVFLRASGTVLGSTGLRFPTPKFDTVHGTSQSPIPSPLAFFHSTHTRSMESSRGPGRLYLGR
ncbi:hypothetical protein DFP72DRAFT_850635 [Ephemerocybe angulata]|uniref:Uncharacterized protein n=1 Tax=Ephemerocybe angulata TaxID=980116 RepID=A0A8H6M112_9AGAR|nr:hypothetical protein DFP72DRAFT_850635 [Tulosesus angulatus]